MASLWQFRVNRAGDQAQVHQAASLVFSFGCSASAVAVNEEVW
jgi:hypothetical protein